MEPRIQARRRWRCGAEWRRGYRDEALHGVTSKVTPLECQHEPSTQEEAMPRTRKDEAPIEVDLPVIEGRYVELDDWTVSFETFPIGSDPAPFFQGLPDDRCQCPHWGVVTAGQLTLRWADREETYVAGDAYYAPPGHLPLVTAGTAVVEFSPTAELESTMAVVQGNMTASGAAS